MKHIKIGFLLFAHL